MKHKELVSELAGRTGWALDDVGGILSAVALEIGTRLVDHKVVCFPGLGQFEAGKEREQGYKSCESLKKAENKYGLAGGDAACKRALPFSSTPARRSILTIHKNGQEKIPLNQAAEAPGPKKGTRHGITRGADAFRKGGANI